MLHKKYEFSGRTVIDQGTSPKIQNNRCDDNRRFGVFVTAEASPILSRTEASDNGVQDIRDER